MPKFNPNKSKYAHPLPLECINLPQVLPHNPVSWLYFCYRYITSINKICEKIPLTISDEGKLLVISKTHIKYLWSHGFFGTGQLSRSEPTWHARTTDRLQIGKGVQQTRRLEEITQLRRTQRLEYKKERAKFEEKMLTLRQQGALDEEIIIQERLFLRQLRDKELEGTLQHQGSSPKKVRLEDTDLILEDGNTILDLENLELMPVEALFLTFALPILAIRTQDLLSLILTDDPTIDEILGICRKYVVYHHYRSRGWCVRSGIKFGCDFILYKRGPPFHHAEFCIMILAAEKPSPDYTWFSTAARVVAGAKKSLVLTYVNTECSKEQIMSFWDQQNYLELFSVFKVGELTYKRWIPGKNRD
ncbi:HBR048Cp [Eremothecium sinecaudum]|uniref:tRNA-splicing endonuclease subunit Sen2 n=1 Tax=Eremothecium sinecaudum TaxID=45286 RepID=A0A120K122_9SACH|nr:HBR048Cp [Eremothecium sinecaudum]AMD18949.1 HBR048Cp [Eremothecium sinecaudum]